MILGNSSYCEREHRGDVQCGRRNREKERRMEERLNSIKKMRGG